MRDIKSKLTEAYIKYRQNILDNYESKDLWTWHWNKSCNKILSALYEY